jgi:hypothetical protein
MVLAYNQPALGLSVDRQQKIVQAARELLGTNYDFGGRLRDKNDGIDCQGLVFYAAERIGSCNWKSFSTMPTKTVKNQELGTPVDGLSPVAFKDLDLDKLQTGDVINMVAPIKNNAEPAIGKLEDQDVWVWHVGMYTQDGHWIHADPFSGKVVEENLKNYLGQYSYQGIYVTRMQNGPSPKYCRKHRPMRKWDIFEEFLRSEYPPADGFSQPLGKNRHRTQNVYATARGKIVKVEKVDRHFKVVVQHTYYENHQKKQISSIYEKLKSVTVKDGDIIQRRQKIGTTNLENRKSCFTFVPDVSAPSFINSHRRLFVPQDEKTIILVDRDGYKMRVYYDKGINSDDFRVSFGDSRGRKRIRGDNKTPKGMYFIAHKHKGHFKGPYGEYYGGHWMKINYPNRFDASYGVDNDIIPTSLEKRIETAWKNRQMTWQKSRLGGGIGFHGWAYEWEDDGELPLSWGCIVMHNQDIKKIYDKIPDSTMVVIF